MEIKSEFFSDNEDIRNFVGKVSDGTGEKNIETWIKHLRENSYLFKKKGWATRNLQGKEKGKTAIICGASPAIQNQIETLKKIQNDNDFVICGISSNLDYLLNQGIKPAYCIVVDADKSTGDDWNPIDMRKTKDITLIAGTYTYPPMLKRWQGPLYFLELQSDDERLERKKREWYGLANGLESGGFPSIMAQFNIMAAVAYLILECQILLFVGHELSFKDEKAKYYVDREDLRDVEARYPHGDIYGNIVHTTTGLLAVKYSLEAFLELLAGAGWFINCTEAGIFGITKKFKDLHIPWIQQLTLKGGISQARQIMRTGKPFYE